MDAAEDPHAGAADERFLAISAVTRRFGPVTAVDNVSLDIRKGEFFSLLGPSGCGKSTLMRMVAGFETPDSGTIHLDGVDIGPEPPHRRPVNMMFQSYALFPHLTVAGNIAFGLKQMGMARQALEDRVREMVRLTQLDGLEQRKPAALSGGQRQRVALARALARSPKVLLLDEPLAALDRKLRKETQGELKRIQAGSGTTFIVVTHDQEEAMALSDRMAVMRKGAIAQLGTPKDIYERPANRFTASFIGDVNLVPAAPAPGGRWRISGLAVSIFATAAPGLAGEGSLALRPERLQLDLSPPPDGHGWHCVIRDRTMLGHAVSLEMETGEGLRLQAVVPSHHPAAGLPSGAKVLASFRPEDAWIVGD